MSAEENAMDQELNNGQEVERSEQFFSPGGEQTSQETSSQSQVAPATQPATKTTKRKQNTDKKSICLLCGKECSSGTIQCTICSMWCHMSCTKLSKEALKGLEIQAKEVGQAYWACRSCMSFNTKWNALMKETSRRQDVTESKVEDNSRNIEELRRLVEATRKEQRDQAKEMEGMSDRMERLMEEELRERESRRLNLVLHGVPEPGPDTTNARDRMEVDKCECEIIFGGMKARTRKHHIRFCRRVGEKGDDPRPMVIGLYSEEERRHILERSRELKNTKFACVTIVPDMTKQQRKGEMRLREEAERRNQELSGEDREKNLKWIVVGSRGEKRLIKGTDREEYSGDGNGYSGNGYGAGGKGGMGGGGGNNGGERRGRETDHSIQQSGDILAAVSAIPHSNSYSNINSNRTNPTFNVTSRRITGPRASSNFNNVNNVGGGNNYGGGGGFSGNNSSSGYNSTNSRYNNSSGQGIYNNGNRGNSNYGGSTYGGNTYRGNFDGGNNYGGNGNNYRGGRGRFSNEYNENGRDINNSPYGANRGGGGGNAPTRPWQETGTRNKEGQNRAENYQERDQDGLARTVVEEEVEWGSGSLPEPIGNKHRERLGSKRLRSWEEDEERDLRRQRS